MTTAIAPDVEAAIRCGHIRMAILQLQAARESLRKAEAHGTLVKLRAVIESAEKHEHVAQAAYRLAKGVS